MAAEHQRLSATDRANLVAYLDGELPEDEARTLATKLTHSVSGRREVETLEATWELLDALPQLQASPEFTERTLSIASQAAAPDDRLIGAARAMSRRALGLLVCVVSIVVGVMIGYLAGRWLWPDRTARLARHLTIAERLDDYRAVKRFSVLRQLDESTLFQDSSN